MNTELFFLIHELSQKYPLLDLLMIFSAEYLIFFLLIILLYFYFKGDTKSKESLIIAIASFFVGLLIVQIIRMFIHQPRPFEAYPIEPLISSAIGPSFPSLHSLASSCLAFSLLLLNSKLTPWYLLSMIFIGFSRIYVGVHFPSDIVGGILTGFVSVSLVYIISQKVSG